MLHDELLPYITETEDKKIFFLTRQCFYSHSRHYKKKVVPWFWPAVDSDLNPIENPIVSFWNANIFSNRILGYGDEAWNLYAMFID